MVPRPAFVYNQQLRTFALNYSRTYKSFLYNSIATDPTHPLFELRQRVVAAKTQKGLWWHVTTGPNTAKKSVVRSWVVRRLRNAFRETLRERGVDEDGTINPRIQRGVIENLRATNRRGIREAVERGGQVEIAGSIKMHAMPPIVTAKFEEVKKETAYIVDGLLDVLEKSLKTQYSQNVAAGRSGVGRWTPDAPGTASRGGFQGKKPEENVWKKRTPSLPSKRNVKSPGQAETIPPRAPRYPSKRTDQSPRPALQDRLGNRQVDVQHIRRRL